MSRNGFPRRYENKILEMGVYAFNGTSKANLTERDDNERFVRKKLPLTFLVWHQNVIGNHLNAYKKYVP